MYTNMNCIIWTIIVFKHSSDQQNSVGSPKLEYPDQLPKITNQEKYFISQLLSDTPKELVCYC